MFPRRFFASGLFAPRYFPGEALGPPPAGPFAGTLGATSTSSTSVVLALATDTGGTPAYSNQLQRSPHGTATFANLGSAVAGATASFTDATVVAGTTYDYRVIVTDFASATATSNVIAVAVPNVSGGGHHHHGGIIATWIRRGRFGRR